MKASNEFGLQMSESQEATLSASRNSRGTSRQRRGPEEPRRLRDLWSVGPAIERDLKSLGVHDVAQLARRNPERLYLQLERTTGKKQDPCVLDTFRAAVAQALDPNLPPEESVWWYYSRLRKEAQQKASGVSTKKRRLGERE